jgi:nucleoside 2-deoxyribosyltransferase
MTVYIAGPLFTAAERTWNSALASALRERGVSVVLPQEEAAALISKSGTFIPSELYENCLQGIAKSDVVVAVLDGADADSGTAFECGFAVARGKQVIGLRTDLRTGGDDSAAGVNLMLSISTQPIQANSLDAKWDLSTLADAIVDRLR